VSAPVRPIALALSLLVAVALPRAAAAFVLSDTPPATRMGMSLGLGNVPFGSLGGSLVTFNQEAARALGTWNATGVGPFQDHEFFSATTVPSPTTVPARCSFDGVNMVSFSTTNCGMAWGDAVGLTYLWLSGGKVIQADVLFNQNQLWDAYPGPLRTRFGGAVVYDLFRVALHEFGHIVGLDHVPPSTVSIMRTTVTDIDQLQPDDIAGAHAVAFSPFGSSPILSVGPAAAEFGKIRAGGGFADRVFTVQNVGGGTLTGQVSVPPPFACVAGCQYSLGVAATAVVTIRFAPPAVAPFSGTAVFSGGQGAAVDLDGTGVVDAVAAFVTDLFAAALGRAPSAGEIDLWTGYLRANPNLAGADGIVHAVFDGAEYRGRPGTPWTHVYLLFVTVLGRAPGSGELGAWTADVIGRLNEVLPVFVSSEEFRNLVPSLANRTAAAAAVTRLFQQALGRAPSAGDLQAWTDYLVATGDMLGFARAVYGSVEYLGTPRTLAQHVTTMFRGFLAREPLAAEVAFFTDSVGDDIAPIEDVFVGSGESAARFQGVFQ